LLRSIDLQLAPGSQAAIVGRSGCGKSTLLQILGTLDRPDAGLLQFDGNDPFTEDEDGLARIRNAHIGFVFQFHHLLPDFTALENVMMPAIIAEQPHMEARERARALLSEVGLNRREDHRPAELSGGEQQRVALARALVREPDLILADEPLGNLDGRTGAAVGELLVEAVERRAASLLVVSHELRWAGQLSRILLLRDGVLSEQRGGLSQDDLYSDRLDP
jgi:lipoprotein-releasing system ATP-binding protein